MQVFLIRHATAVDETLELSDAARFLTEHGRNQARNLGDRLRWHDCEPTRVWSSPLVRAVQTAELVVSGLHSATTIEILPSLAPSESPRGVVTAIHALPADALVVIVGHEPTLSELGALLVGDPQFPPLDKASACRIVDGTLRWRFDWDADAPIAVTG
ncbi:MAG TPA: phosphohistidine phosphatase SixA [Kofleriaceae bacterium]|nr:phosphohistidine phosphatase SixA [Kofleriaceae bacterium]